MVRKSSYTDLARSFFRQHQDKKGRLGAKAYHPLTPPLCHTYNVLKRKDCLAAIYSEYFRKTYYLDVSDRKEFYQEQGGYNANCRLLRPVTGFVPGLNNLCPLESGISGRYNLLAVQRIIGLFGADTLGYIETTLAWDGSKFRPVSESVTPV